MRHDGEQPAALQPRSLARRAPTLSLTDFRARGRSLAWTTITLTYKEAEASSTPTFAMKGARSGIYSGWPFPRKRLRTPPTWLFARGLSVARLGGASPSLTDWIGRVHRTTLRALWRDNLHSRQALQTGRHAGQVFSTTSALWRGERTVLCRARACAPVAYRGPGRASRTPE